MTATPDLNSGNIAGNSSGNPLYSGRGATPIPDPTILTSQALAREIAALREILEARIEGDKRIIETRLDGMDKAISLLQETTTDKVSSKIVEHVSALKELHEFCCPRLASTGAPACLAPGITHCRSVVTALSGT